MKLTEGTNPIEYEFWNTAIKGCRFALYPITGTHNEEDVLRAKRWLHNNQDVESLQVRWKNVDDITDNPQKIPDLMIIKNLQVEIGKRDSYIIELTDTLSKSNKENTGDRITKEERKEFKKDKFYTELSETIKALEHKLNRCARDKEDLIIRMNQPK